MSEVIIKPVLSEKTQGKAGEYVFLVQKQATKSKVKEAIEKLFGVTVARVHTQKVRGKTKKLGRRTFTTPDLKKAVVRVAKDQKIELLEPEKEKKKKK